MAFNFSRQSLLKLGCQRESTIPQEAGQIQGSEPPISGGFLQGEAYKSDFLQIRAQHRHTLSGAGRGLKVGAERGEGLWKGESGKTWGGVPGADGR